MPCNRENTTKEIISCRIQQRIWKDKRKLAFSRKFSAEPYYSSNWERIEKRRRKLQEEIQLIDSIIVLYKSELKALKSRLDE